MQSISFNKLINSKSKTIVLCGVLSFSLFLCFVFCILSIFYVINFYLFFRGKQIQRPHRKEIHNKLSASFYCLQLKTIIKMINWCLIVDCLMHTKIELYRERRKMEELCFLLPSISIKEFLFLLASIFFCYIIFIKNL